MPYTPQLRSDEITADRINHEINRAKEMGVTITGLLARGEWNEINNDADSSLYFENTYGESVRISGASFLWYNEDRTEVLRFTPGPNSRLNLEVGGTK